MGVSFLPRVYLMNPPGHLLFSKSNFRCIRGILRCVFNIKVAHVHFRKRDLLYSYKLLITYAYYLDKHYVNNRAKKTYLKSDATLFAKLGANVAISGLSDLVLCIIAAQGAAKIQTFKV